MIHYHNTEKLCHSVRYTNTIMKQCQPRQFQNSKHSTKPVMRLKQMLMIPTIT